jgi:hypothetical protein
VDWLFTVVVIAASALMALLSIYVGYRLFHYERS